MTHSIEQSYCCFLHVSVVISSRLKNSENIPEYANLVTSSQKNTNLNERLFPKFPIATIEHYLEFKFMLMSSHHLLFIFKDT